MTKIICKLSGGIMIPKNLCVNCGRKITLSEGYVRASIGSRKQSLSLDFPLCNECEGVRKHVEDIEGKRAVRGWLVGLPIGVVGYFIYHIIAGRNSISWIGLLLAWFLAITIVYNLFQKKLSKESINSQDQKISDEIKSSVKLSDYKEVHAWADGTVTFHFKNPLYATEFNSANMIKILNISI